MPSLKELRARRGKRERKLRRELRAQVEREIKLTLDNEEYEQERSELFALIAQLKTELIQLSRRSSALRESLFSLQIPCTRQNTPTACAFLFRVEGHNADRRPTWTDAPGQSQHFLGDVYYLTVSGEIVERLEKGREHLGTESASRVSSGDYTTHNTTFSWIVDALQRLKSEAKSLA